MQFQAANIKAAFLNRNPKPLSQNMDMAQKQKADSWQKFVKGKGAKKVTGFFTGTKKDSMFSVAGDGKVSCSLLAIVLSRWHWYVNCVL